MMTIPSGRICYFCPDFPQPSGGIRTIYRHVNVLRAAGFEAVVVHQKREFVADWHRYPAPVIWLEDRPEFNAADTLIFPEVMGEMVRRTQGFGGRRYVFALSWLPSYSNLKPGECWRDLGVDGVMVQSETVARAVAWSEGRAAHLIPPFVDPALYYVTDAGRDDDPFRTEESAHGVEAPGATEAATRNTIVYLTRKDRAGAWLHGLLTARATSAGLAWQALRQLDEMTYAAHLRRARLYVPTTVQEGLHVSVLEAMACGVLVVGFAAVGGNDYMVGAGKVDEDAAQNCILVENGDLPALAVRLDEVLTVIADDPMAFSTIRANARLTAQRFQDPGPQRDALIALFGTPSQV